MVLNSVLIDHLTGDPPAATRTVHADASHRPL